jgi:hypothetical protein
MTDPIEAFYERQRAIGVYLSERKEVSFAQDVEDAMRKNLALAAASYFEEQIVSLLCDFAARKSNGCTELVAFIQNKALKRQFHTLFEWDKGKNANSFFTLFGKGFKAEVEALVKENDALVSAVRAFLELGYLRNRIVHENYASFVTDKTADEILRAYREARHFVDFLRQRFGT